VTREEYGRAYETGCRRTIRFLVSRGLPSAEACEAAQAAWARGWEKRHQIRSEDSTISWINAIALNIYRTSLRTGCLNEEFQDRPVPPKASLIHIDAEMILNECRPAERDLLEKHYLLGYRIQELARKEGCPASTIRVRLMRARRRIRQHMDCKGRRASFQFAKAA